MANFLKNKPTSRSQNMSAAEIWMKVGAFIIVLAVVVYSEYLFIGIIIDILPTGINMIGAITGAVATGASVLALIGAKLVWIRPGSQYIWSWVFMGMEVVILGLNDMLAFALHAGHVTGFLAGWESITAAGPLAAMVGWIFIIFLDLAQVERQKDLELESKRLEAERKYTQAAFEAEMGLRHSHLNQVTSRLDDVMSSDMVQQQIVDHAQRMVTKVLTDVSGISAGITNVVLPPAQQQPLQLPTPLAQEASTSTPVHPAQDESEMRQMFEKAKANPQAYTRWYPPSLDPEKQIAAIQRGEYIPGMSIEPVPQENLNVDRNALQRAYDAGYRYVSGIHSGSSGNMQDHESRVIPSILAEQNGHNGTGDDAKK